MALVAGFDGHDRRLGVNFAAIMLRDRFLGTGLGWIWSVLQPAMLIAVFVFVFTVLFPSRMSGHENSQLAFAIWLISGYGPWLAINEGIMGGATSVISQAAVVKNMAFKTEILPIAATLLGLVPLLVTIVILTVLIVVDGRMPTTIWLIMIPVLFFQSLFVAGVGLFLGATNVFMRDITLALPSILTMLLFLSPIFYSIEMYDPAIRAAVQWNPFYVIANGYRAPIVDGELPPIWQLIYLALLSIVTFWAGLAFFRQRKTYFHDRL